MLVEYLVRGTSSGAAATDSLLRELDAAEQPCEGVEVLQGHPHQVAEGADVLACSHNYTSGVIAWAPEDGPTNMQIEAALDTFEETA